MTDASRQEKYKKLEPTLPLSPVIQACTGILLLLFALLPAIAETAEEGQGKIDTLEALIAAGGDHMGTDTCTDCHEDHAEHVNHRTDCETCHGPGGTHVDLMIEEKPDTGTLISFDGDNMPSAEIRSAVCADCHKGGALMHWPSSAHEGDDMACTSCHTVHRPGLAMERTTQSEVCYRCHQNIRAQSHQISTHPIQEGKVICSDCHNPHGASGPAELKQMSINENCFICHAEKRGPFLWEHYPATEDCTLCHRVHGSSHPALLTRQGPQLCQQCHADIRTQGRTHIRRFYDFDNPDPNRDRAVVGMNCANCHSKVHGSNHPSGVNLLR